MLLRICLIVALAAGLAGLAFSFMLKGKVTALSEQRDNFKTNMETAQANEQTAKRDAAKASKEAKDAKDELATTQQQLDETRTRATETEARATKLSADLEKTTNERNLAQRELASWKATGETPDRILALKNEARRLGQERDVFAEEKKVMGREIVRLNEKINIYEGVRTEVIMPDVRGNIIAVDNTYHFVVLDVGSDLGLKENGMMIASRNGQLIAKLQIVRLEPNRAIANILPEWKEADVQDGDPVMTSYEALAKQ